MKKLILTCMAAIIILPLSAQDSTEVRIEEFTISDNYETSIEFSKNGNESWRNTAKFWKKPAKKRTDFPRWYDGHWSGIGLNYNGLVSSLSDLSLPAGATDMAQSPRSIGVTINLIDVMLPITRNIGIVSGLGMEFNNFRFSKDIAFMMVDGVTQIDYQYIDRGINIETSKINTAYLNIPILLEFQFGYRNRFFVNGGVIGGLRMGAHTKLKASHDEFNGKFKDHDNISLKTFHYGYTVGLGYNQWGITASYYPGSIFRNNTGPKLEHVNVGIVWLLNYGSR